MNKVIKIMSFGSTAAIYVLLTGSYIASYFSNFNFCFANNTVGEYWIELAMFILFGITTSIILWRDLVDR